MRNLIPENKILGQKTFRRSGEKFERWKTRVWTLNMALFTSKCLLERLVIQCLGLNQDKVRPFFEKKRRTRKTQNIKINMTCGSDFRLKKVDLLLQIFLTCSRENSRVGTSPPMMKSVWSHLKTNKYSYYYTVTL
jgi:lipopolysaccharide/colanic/teichoic acid biosynthesis glycosyltransferase